MSKLTNVRVERKPHRVTVIANGKHGASDRHVRFNLSTGALTYTNEPHKLHIGVGEGDDTYSEWTWIELGLDDLVHVLEELFDVTIDIPEPKKLG